MALQVAYRYRQQNPDLAKRKQESMEVKRKFPGKVPLVVGRATRSELPDLNRDRYLFPAVTKVSGLIQFINSEVERPDKAPLYIYVNNEVIVSHDSTMAELYQEYRDDDFFLYLAYYEKSIHRHLQARPPSPVDK